MNVGRGGKRLKSKHHSFLFYKGISLVILNAIILIIMKNASLILLWLLAANTGMKAQVNNLSTGRQKAIAALIGQYADARERSDTTLLRGILTGEIDQLVSTGEWRTGIKAAMQGMERSSANRPGTRSLIVDKIRLLTPGCALVDCRYEIAQAGEPTRRMWSSFMVVDDNGKWKITAIRNMLPAENK